MKLIKDTEFLVIDFETITPKGRSPEPIEVGILRIKQNKIDDSASINWLIKPPEGIKNHNTIEYFNYIQTEI